jgi:hypothetical protein
MICATHALLQRNAALNIPALSTTSSCCAARRNTQMLCVQRREKTVR